MKGEPKPVDGNANLINFFTEEGSFGPDQIRGSLRLVSSGVRFSLLEYDPLLRQQNVSRGTIELVHAVVCANGEYTPPVDELDPMVDIDINVSTSNKPSDELFVTSTPDISAELSERFCHYMQRDYTTFSLVIHLIHGIEKNTRRQETLLTVSPSRADRARRGGGFLGTDEPNEFNQFKRTLVMRSPRASQPDQIKRGGAASRTAVMRQTSLFNRKNGRGTGKRGKKAKTKRGREVSDSRLDLIRAPYVLYGVKYIDPVSLQLPNTSASHLDLGRAPYVLYGVKYIDLVSLASLAPFSGRGAGGTT